MASLSTGRTGINQANLSSLSIHRTLHALAESCMLACTVKMLALLKQKDEIHRGNAGASASIVKVSKNHQSCIDRRRVIGREDILASWLPVSISSKSGFPGCRSTHLSFSLKFSANVLLYFS